MEVRVGRSKYQYMEANQQRRALGLKSKIPDLEKTLETVQFLQTRKVCVCVCVCDVRVCVCVCVEGE